MFSMIVSVLWVISSVLTLGVKAVFMVATMNDVKQAQYRSMCAYQHLQSARMGHQWFLVGSLMGFMILTLCYIIGLIKFWVVVVDVVVFVLSFILNILFLGYLKRKARA